MDEIVPLTDEVKTADALERGRVILNTLLPSLEREMTGKVVAIHVDTGEYFVAKTSSSARFGLRKRHPRGVIVTSNIGPAREDDLLVRRMLSSQTMPGQAKQ